MLSRISLLTIIFNLIFSQIFFSEYAEGSSNNKYLEIYNAGDSVVDLTGFAFPSTSNDPDVPGEYEYWNEFDGGSAINPGDVFVICHGSSDQSILDECDQFHTYLSNGNDGYCIVSGTSDDYTLVDCVGDWLANPNPGQSSGGWEVAGVSEATKDHTLVRKSSVLSGNDGNWSLSAGTDEANSEWLVYDQNTWDYVGYHNADTSGNIYGCMDSTACNYNQDATVDNGTCATEDCLGECGGSAVIDDCNVCGGENSSMDCENVCDGNAIVDDCGICNGDGTGCDGAGLFFSEYSEGSSNNKYLEIVNATDQTINLTGFAFPSTANAPDTPGEHEYWNNFTEGSTISPGDVFVICHGSSEQSILDECDQFHTYLSNGNDGYCLVVGTEDDYTIVDCVGDFNADPGQGWEVAGVANGTKDHTLVRKSTVLSGNYGNWSLSAGTNEADSEWLVYDLNTWDYLGYHTIDNSGNIYGCMDSTACNYNPDATADNGTCATEDCLGECGGSNLIDDCGVCGGENASLDCENVCDGNAVLDDCGECIGTNTGQEPCELEESSMIDIINNCSSDLGNSIDCDGSYDLSANSASQCPLYEQSVITSGIIIDYFDITPFGGPHSFTIQDTGGNQIDFVVWPESSSYQDGFDITATDLNVLTQEPFGVYEVQITGELGAYCDDDQQLDISSEWQITVEYESDIIIDSGEEGCLAGGDANGDGIVNVVDIVQMVSLILDSSGGYNECADTNNDGILNVVDIVSVVSIILGN